jgi:hypothetical protein
MKRRQLAAPQEKRPPEERQTMSDLAHSVFTTSVANASLLGVIGTAFAVRRRRFGGDNSLREVT